MLSAWLQRTPPGFSALATVLKNGFSTRSCAGPDAINRRRKKQKMNSATAKFQMNTGSIMLGNQ